MFQVQLPRPTSPTPMYFNLIYTHVHPRLQGSLSMSPLVCFTCFFVSLVSTRHPKFNISENTHPYGIVRTGPKPQWHLSWK